ncbi:ABC transporter permease [candidate division KSB1 bacterium]
MLRSYIKVALRDMLKYKSFSIINIFGLAIGMACFILIFSYVQFELSYDRFHKDHENIYRIVLDRQFPTSTFKYSVVGAGMCRNVVDDLPEVLDGTRILRGGEVVIGYGDKTFFENGVFFADSSYFDIFSHEVISGNLNTALNGPNKVVINRTIAEKYFGEEDALNKTVRFNNGNFTVTAVIEDIPLNSHFHFDFLVSLSTIPNIYDSNIWVAYSVYTYVKLIDGALPGDIVAKIPELIKIYAGPQIVEVTGNSFDNYLAAGNNYIYSLQNLADIHLYSDYTYEIEPNGSMTYVYIFSIIAILILIIACINFMNLSTARSSRRAKEVGVRKVLGSYKKQLIAQFLSESIMYCFISLILALIVVKLALPYFIDITGRQIEISYINDPDIMFFLLGLMIFVGLISGSYPALFLSSFMPVKVLKGEVASGAKKQHFRNGLVVFQFAVSIALIVAAFVIFQQTKFMINKDLGFNKEQVVVVNRALSLGVQKQAFKDELLSDSRIISVSYSTSLPGRLIGNASFQLPGEPTEEFHLLSRILVDKNFIETLELEFEEGENFKGISSLDSLSVIVTQTTADNLGWKEGAVNKEIIMAGSDARLKVTGVVKDFHFTSLHNEITPIVLQPDLFNGGNIASIRISTDNIEETLEFIESKWDEFVPGQPFSSTFMDDDFAQLYISEKTTEKIIGFFSILAVFIACLGLLGLAAYTADQRTKEVGIRKVLGATLPNLLLLLSKEFAKLIGLSFLIAVPTAYIVLNDWLEDFAYRIDIPYFLFVLAGLITLVIALVTVSFQTIKLARTNPIDSIKYE